MSWSKKIKGNIDGFIFFILIKKTQFVKLAQSLNIIHLQKSKTKIHHGFDSGKKDVPFVPTFCKKLSKNKGVWGKFKTIQCFIFYLRPTADQKANMAFCNKLYHI
ncbi:MAG: hypothetical protein H0A76_12725 [Candidatus Thiodubiliella endoseptemdiera]|uniref:Uncharacterized protein n=1 Tax=Candidatus Thiodubiliella endoseptemdiera TaxID=2738886 RepID=A0A853FAJ1_9GAMM|nr:hypothetical protein [Candidatus Thiodubiliella endoseptemdiera]